MNRQIDLQEYDRAGNPITYAVPLHGSNNGVFWDGHICATVAEIAAALQEKRERDNPKPLTMEQIQRMDGKPVWYPIYGWGVLMHTVRGKRSRMVIVFAKCWKLAEGIVQDGIYASQPSNVVGSIHDQQPQCK